MSARGLRRIQTVASHLKATEFAVRKEQELKQEADAWNAPSIADHIPLATFEEIPALDLGPFFATGSKDALKAVAEQLRHANTHVGFYYITGHGVPMELIESTFAAAKAFHDLPIQTKLKCRMDSGARGSSGAGYLGMLNRKLPARKTPNVNEAFVVKQLPELGFTLDTAPWPTEDFPRFKSAVGRYAAAMQALALRLLPVFAEALHLHPHYFDDAFRSPMYRLRLSHYPPTPAGDFGIHPHKDTSFFTILASTDAEGLVVFSRQRRGWVRARHMPGALVVNTGQLLQQITNDTWAATRHYALNVHKSTAVDRQPGSRAVSAKRAGARFGKGRYSLPFFFNATASHRMAVVPTCISPSQPAKYQPTSYLEGQGVVQGE